MWFDIDFKADYINRERTFERRGTHAAMESEFREIDELGNWNAVYQVKPWISVLVRPDGRMLIGDRIAKLTRDCVRKRYNGRRDSR